MSAELVEVQFPRFLSDLRARVELMRDEALKESSGILRREEEASIRERFYRTGAGLRSLEEETVTEGQKKIYRLFPTAFYMIFGEYGTGRRGAATGLPVPRGYKHGPKPGMAARRYSRIAMGKARPQIEAVFIERAKVFAKNLTVN